MKIDERIAQTDALWGRTSAEIRVEFSGCLARLGELICRGDPALDAALEDTAAIVQALGLKMLAGGLSGAKLLTMLSAAPNVLALAEPLLAIGARVSAMAPTFDTDEG